MTAVRAASTRQAGGRAVLAGLVARRAARSGLVWGVGFAVYVAAETLAYTSAYPTAASRAGLERAYGSNVGLDALIGPARAIGTVTGYAAWRLLGVLGVLGSVWALLLATRLVRGEEDAGRAELPLSGPTTPRSAAAQQALGLAAGALALFGCVALATVLTARARSVDFTVPASLFFALALVAGPLAFLAIGMLAAQLMGTRRQAAGLAGAVFAVAYALRMVADSDRAARWLRWVSPLGWIEQARPFTRPVPVALLPILGLVLLAGGAAIALAGRRDVGRGVFATRDVAAPRLRLLAGPAGLAARMQRTSILGWTAGIAAFALLVGLLAQDSTRDPTGSRTVAAALARLGGRGSLLEVYLALMLLALAATLGFVVGGQLGALRAEEASGRLDALLVRPVGRVRWLAGRLAITAGTVTGAALVAGLCTWAGARSQHAAVRLGTVLAAALDLVPSAVFLLGVGALAFGLLPRRATGAYWAYVAWSALVEFLGGAVRVDHWLLDTSVFFHISPAPASRPDWTQAAILAALGVGAMAAGAAAFVRRDLVPD